MLNRIQAFFDFFPSDLTPSQHFRNLAFIGIALLIVIGLMTGWSVTFSILCVIAGGFAGVLGYDWLVSQPAGNGNLRQVSERIRSGAQLFLFDLYKSIAWFSLLLAVLIGLTINWSAAFGYLTGVLVAELVGYLGFNLTLNTRSIVLHATRRHLLAITQLALSSGIISGLLVSGAALFGVAFYYTVLMVGETDFMFVILVSFAAGAASVSLFVNLGGAVFVQSSLPLRQDNAAQEKLESTTAQTSSIIQTIAEHVSQYTGVIVDVFATVITILVASILINRGYATIDHLATYPLVIMALAILSVIVVLQVLKRLQADIRPGLLVDRLILTSAMLNAILLLPVSWWMFDQTQLYEQIGASIHQLYMSVLAGLFLAVLMTFTGYCQCSTLLSTGSSKWTQLRSAILYSIVLIVLYISYQMAGLIGVEVSILGFLSLSAIIVAVSSLGQLLGCADSENTDTTQQSEQQQVALNAKIATSAYRLVSSVLVVVILAIAFAIQFSAEQLVSPSNLLFLMGVVIGIATLFGFCAILIKLVSRVTVGAQSNNSSSHYAITELAKRCKREMFFPVLALVVSVVLIVLIFSYKTVCGFIIGTGFAGLFIGIAAVNGDKAWLVSKRYLGYFWPASNTPVDWEATHSGSLMDAAYRRAIVSTISPVVKMIAVLALLLTV